ncbi:mitochondrial import inner membrane translocase subunit Tim23 isoform X1 [Arapaima gigas]
MSPLSPYLSVEPRHVDQGSEWVGPVSAVNIRGRFELAFVTIGGCCLAGAGFGTVNGLRMGLQATQNLAWSKPWNVQVLNMVTRQGTSWTNTLGCVALLYSMCGVAMEKARGTEDDINTVAAATLAGALFKSRGGVQGAVRGGLFGLAVSGFYSLYNNWDHLKSRLPHLY